VYILLIIVEERAYNLVGGVTCFPMLSPSRLRRA
jgi:hypothetical protein